MFPNWSACHQSLQAAGRHYGRCHAIWRNRGKEGEGGQVTITSLLTCQPGQVLGDPCVHKCFSTIVAGCNQSTVCCSWGTKVWQSTMSSLRERESAMPRIILPSSWKVDNTTWVKRGWAMMLSIVRIFTCQCNDYISLICTNANISFHTQILKNKPCICKSFSGVKLVVSS